MRKVRTTALGTKVQLIIRMLVEQTFALYSALADVPPGTLNCSAYLVQGIDLTFALYSTFADAHCGILNCSERSALICYARAGTARYDLREHAFRAQVFSAF